MVKGKDNRTAFESLKWGKWGDSFVLLARFETHRALKNVSRVYSEWDCPPFPDPVVRPLNKLWCAKAG